MEQTSYNKLVGTVWWYRTVDVILYRTGIKTYRLCSHHYTGGRIFIRSFTMANNRPIYFKLYKKKNVLALSSKALLLYLYLLTNESTTMTGCYQLSIALTMEQTRLSKDEIEICMEELKTQGLIEVSDETGELLITDWGSYNWNVSPMIMEAVYKEARFIDDVGFRNRILENKSGSKDPAKENTDEEFEKIWDLYPKKTNRSRVKSESIKAVCKVGFDRMKICINNYRKTIVDKEDKYVLNGDTFFNGRYKDFFTDVSKVDRTSPVNNDLIRARVSQAYESIIKNFPKNLMDGNEKQYLWVAIKGAGSEWDIINAADSIKAYLDEHGTQKISFKEFMEQWLKRKKG